MTPEKFNHHEYRDGLARDLKDLRGTEDGSKEARTFLDSAHKTSRYQAGKFAHEEERDSKHALNPKTTAESKEEGKSPLEIGYELVTTPSPVHFVMGGIGNVLGQPNSRSTTYELYYFDKEKGRLVTAKSANVSDDGVFYLDNNESSGIGIPLFEKKVDEHGTLFVCRIPFRGKPGNPYVSDDRGGVHMTGGIYVQKAHANSLPHEVREKLFNPGGVDTDYLLQLVLKCEESFAPAYFAEVQKLLQTTR